MKMYIGKEKDVESGLSVHGVRKHDYETGLFTTTPPQNQILGAVH
jgi:hypothetical protein